jgi:hypothetical protein
MTRKATWIGPDRSIRLQGQPARLIKRGDEFTIATGETVGGEGKLWKAQAAKKPTGKKADTTPTTPEE